VILIVTVAGVDEVVPFLARYVKLSVVDVGLLLNTYVNEPSALRVKVPEWLAGGVTSSAVRPDPVSFAKTPGLLTTRVVCATALA
jgi:hypothetical protein